MAHSPYEPEGIGRGVDPDSPEVYGAGADVAPGTAYQETYVAPAAPVDDLYAPVVDDLYAPVTEPVVDPGTSSSTGSGVQDKAAEVKDKAGDVKDTAADQGRRVADTAKESAAQVKDTAVEQGQQVAAVAKDEAGNVAAEAASSIRDIVGQGRTELTSQLGTSQNRVADYVHSLADELGTLASGGGDGTGPLADLAHRGARTGGELSQWLSEHEPADVLAEVTRFARRRPWAFLGASLLTGVVVGRVTRSLAAEAKDEHDAQQAVTRTPQPAVTGPTFAAPVTTGDETPGYEATTTTPGYGSTTPGYESTTPGYESTTTTPGYTSGYVAGDLPENPAPQTWTGGSR